MLLGIRLPICFKLYIGDVSEIKAEEDISITIPRAEVMKRLRDRGHPILLFGENEQQSFKRLRRIEIQEPEANKVVIRLTLVRIRDPRLIKFVLQGFRNDFQEAMEKVDQAYLDEILGTGTEVITLESYLYESFE